MILPFLARDLFDVVLDIEKYPEFLPWCKEVVILASSPNFLTAKVTAQFKGVNPWYKCNIDFSPPDDYRPGYIQVKAIEGAFKRLHNVWEFSPQVPHGTLVQFNIEFEFGSAFLQVLLSLVYKRAQYKIINAFKERAKQKCRNIFI